MLAIKLFYLSYKNMVRKKQEIKKEKKYTIYYI